jgi:hypothetical protein
MFQRNKLSHAIAMLVLVSWVEITDVAGQGVRRSVVNPNNTQPLANFRYQPNINNIAVPAPPVPVADDVVKRDYFGLKLRGLPDEDIWAYSNQENIDRKKQGLGPVTVVLDKEQSWNIYKDDIYKGDRATFDKQWETVSNEYKAFKAKKEDELYYAWNNKQLEDPRPYRYSIQGKLPMGRQFEDFKPSANFLPIGNYYYINGTLREKREAHPVSAGVIISIAVAGVVLVVIIGFLFHRMVYSGKKQKNDS